MKILLTGATGFIGKTLYSSLPESVQVLLRKPNSAYSNYFYLKDYDSRSDFSSALTGKDVVIHLASINSDKIYQNCSMSIENAFDFNVKTTLALAKQSAQSGVKRFIFLSSIKVNGESTSDRAPFTANDYPSPKDSYGFSKLEAEQQLFELGKKTGMEVVIIRPPLVYGEGVKANFASLMRLVEKGLPLPFRAIKHNKRSLISVYNLVDLIKVCIEHPNAANQVFLASDDHDLSSAEMVALMAKVQGKKNLSVPVPAWFFKFAGKLLNKNYAISRLTGSLQLDINHTINTLDWQPPYSVEHGFKLAAKKPPKK